MAALLVSPSDHAIPLSATPSILKKRLTIADTGATDHMFPERSSFISYHRSAKSRVRLGNNSFAPILGEGTAIVSLNGKTVMVRDALHVPGLHSPLYSLRAHAKQPGCGFIGDDDLGGVFVYFPTFCLQADTTRDCHLSYAPLGTTVALRDLDYAQPRRRASANAATDATAASPPAKPRPKRLGTDWREITFARHAPKAGSPPAQSELHPDSIESGEPTSMSVMTKDEILEHLHHDATSLPPVRPCDTPNGADKKTHWSAEELHRVTGCRKFKDYRKLLSITRNGTFSDVGEFPVALGPMPQFSSPIEERASTGRTSVTSTRCT